MSRWKSPYGVKTNQTTYDASTFTCQKCLEKGHFTYQCTGKRKYVSRLSQTTLLHKRMEVEANSTPLIKHVGSGNGLESQSEDHQTTLLHNYKRMKVEGQPTPITLGVESPSGKTSSGTSEDSESDSTSSDSEDSSSSSDTRDSESDSTSSSSSSSSSCDSSSSSSSDDD